MEDTKQMKNPYEKMPDEVAREQIIQDIFRLDQTKREIRDQLRSASKEAKVEKRDIDQDWLHRAKRKIDMLTKERETLRSTLKEVNSRIRERRRRTHGVKDSSLASFFLAAAQELLDRETYERIEEIAALRAAQSLSPTAQKKDTV